MVIDQMVSIRMHVIPEGHCDESLSALEACAAPPVEHAQDAIGSGPAQCRSVRCSAMESTGA
eukprot:366025-Chlamydomonas_euryale.AAC.9